MRILFLADHELWPPTSGVAQRMLHLATGLASRHEVTLIVLHWWDGDLTTFPGAAAFTEIHTVPYSSCRFAREGRLEPDVSLVRQLRISAVPEVVRRHRSEQLLALLGSLDPGSFDAVWVTRGYFAEHAIASGYRPIVVDLPDLETELRARRLAPGVAPLARAARTIDLHRTRHWERRLVERVAAVAVCKPSDVEFFPDGVTNVHVVGNGVAPQPDARPELERTDEILFVGTLHYEPNVDAARWFHDRILPRIRRARPSTRFVVVGKHPAPAVGALDDGNGCVVHADVPDLTDHYQRAGVVVVPVRLGGGTRIKAIEALAHGKALVSTTVGMDGIDARPGIDYLAADTDEAFADACIRLLGNAELRRRLGASGRDRVVSRHSWVGAVDDADRMLSSVR